MESGEDAFSWLGHASFLFRINGISILTDPCLLSLPGTKRLVQSPFKFSEIRNLDYILFTHSHRDHFDKRSVCAILETNPDVHFLVPLRMGKLLKKLGAKNITEAGWYQEYNLEKANGLRIVFLPAKHWNRRLMFDTNRELWGSFWIGSEKQSIYFAGDTAFDNHFTEIRNLFPEIRHAFIPIGAYKPSYIMKDAHISPQEAVEAFQLLHAKQFIPMHFGTYDLSDEPVGEPLRILQQFQAEGKLGGNLISSAVGELVRL
jgi:L-ascorbate metabolism protein UlaG (beta-lactamase superfamily)